MPRQSKQWLRHRRKKAMEQEEREFYELLNDYKETEAEKLVRGLIDAAEKDSLWTKHK